MREQEGGESFSSQLDKSVDIDLNEENLISGLVSEKIKIDEERSEWLDRKVEYLAQWDNFTDYNLPEIVEGQQPIHIPMTFEKIQLWHSRMYNAIFSMDPIFHVEPLGKAHIDEVESVKMAMRWYLRDEINHRKGLKPVFDELLWDVGADGWACLYKRWECHKRKSQLLRKIDAKNLIAEAQEVQADIIEKKKPRRNLKGYEEISKIITVFEGVSLETVPQENIYFPDYIPTSGDMNYPQMVMIEVTKTGQEIEYLKQQGIYDEEAANQTLLAGRGDYDHRKRELKDAKEQFAGLNINSRRIQEPYVLHIVFYREDFDDDGYPEEYIFTVSLKAKVVLKKTYLDRVCPDGNRPLFKFDLIKRPRSAYSKGFAEILYPYNREIDDFHNIRRANMLIANVPWGFYRASSGLEKEDIRIKPGVFKPVDDPQSDVHPITFGNVTTAWIQEEGMTQSYADKLTSLPAMMSGQVPSTVGPLRSTSGVTALLNESQATMNIYLDRFRDPCGQLFRSIHADLRTRLPESIFIRVLGEGAKSIVDEAGFFKMMKLNRADIMGDYKWSLAVNNATFNPEKDRQDTMAVAQLLSNQMNIQMGIVTQKNIYNITKDLLMKYGKQDFDKYITAPPDAFNPLSLYDEYSAIINGRVPYVVMNDDHQGKVAGLLGLMQSAEYQEGKLMGSVSPLADMIFAQVVQTHQAYLQLIQSAQAMQNNSGMQIPATLGAESAGVGPQQNQNLPSPNEGQQQSEAAPQGAPQ